MADILLILLFGWLLFHAVKLAGKIAWCGMKVIAVMLFITALPSLVICLLTAGGVLLLMPLCMLVGAITLLNRCA